MIRCFQPQKALSRMFPPQKVDAKNNSCFFKIYISSKQSNDKILNLLLHTSCTPGSSEPKSRTKKVECLKAYPAETLRQLLPTGILLRTRASLLTYIRSSTAVWVRYMGFRSLPC